MHNENEVVNLYLDDIIPNRFQPREVFDEKALQELSASIKQHGVIQPIIVRNIGNKYEIIAGERRYKASALAGLTKIPAIVRDLDDKESSKIALLENLQRRDLNALEEAKTYQKILELDQMTQEELAKTMGKSQSAVANKLRLLSLPDDIQDALMKEQISERHARSLLNIASAKDQVDLMKKVIQTRMTVRELDEEVKKMNENPLVNNTPVTEGPRFVDRYTDIEPVESSSIDINQLRSQSQNILPEEKPQANLDSLLKVAVEETEPVPQNYKFVPSFDDETSIADETPLKEQILPSFDNITDMPSLSNTPVINPIEPETSILGTSTIPKVVPVDEPSEIEEIDTLDLDTPMMTEPAIPDFPTYTMPTMADLPSLPDDKSLPGQDTITSSISNSVILDRSLNRNAVLDLRGAINMIRDLSNTMEKNGLKVDIEEIDLQDQYQITIKIEK